MLDARIMQPTPIAIPPSVIYTPVELNSRPKTKPTIGLSWRAEPCDWRRSLPVELVASLVDHLPCDVEILQQSLTPKEAGHFPAARSRSLLEMGDVIAGLDLVITVDTVVAHMAAGFGRATWLLLHANSDGRWRPSPAESDWTPRMRIYEQSHPGDWHTVVRMVADDLCLCCQGESFVLA
jgi:Glycosyltransferase family 9 (heptosyltransferase)